MSETNNKYIIKNLSPWMLDELLAFSELAKFDLIFLRKQEKSFDKDLKRLESNGIKIYKHPYKGGNVFTKIFFLFSFLLKNLSKFSFDYNGVIGLKSIWWFLKMDLSLFNSNSNIHAQFATQAAIISLMIKEYYGNKPDYSFTFHAYDIYFKNKWFNKLVKESVNSFSISEYNIKYVNENYLKSKRIKLSKLGVFREKMNSIQKKKDKEVFKIGFLSWFDEKKGIFYLLDAMKKLKKDCKNNIKLVMAGDGFLKEKIAEYINENRLNDVVEYQGRINREDKQSFFLSLDAFILPSISLENDQDGIPVVLMEAISYGLPIISTNVSGIPEICIDGYNGFLIEERKVEQIVFAIKKMVNNRLDANNRFSKNSLVLSEEYDIEKNSSRKIQLLNWT